LPVRSVAVLKRLVLLVRQRDQRDEKQHRPFAVEHAVESGHLADERLPGRGRRDDQLVLPVHRAVFDGEALDRQERVEAGLDVVLNTGVERERVDRDQVDVVDRRRYLVELRQVGVQLPREEVRDAF